VKMTMSAAVILRRFMRATVTNAPDIVNRVRPFDLAPQGETDEGHTER
jgi:hypothetical protein